ncbi:MAG: PIN domain-containing protein [Actinomycetota bacterium]
MIVENNSAHARHATGRPGQAKARSGGRRPRLRAPGRADCKNADAHHFERAGQVQRALAEEGLRGRKVPDLVIAAVAESASLTVLHYDADFDHIAAVTGQPTDWIVERGSVS